MGGKRKKKKKKSPGRSEYGSVSQLHYLYLGKHSNGITQRLKTKLQFILKLKRKYEDAPAFETYLDAPQTELYSAYSPVVWTLKVDVE